MPHPAASPHEAIPASETCVQCAPPSLLVQMPSSIKVRLLELTPTNHVYISLRPGTTEISARYMGHETDEVGGQLVVLRAPAVPGWFASRVQFTPSGEE